MTLDDLVRCLNESDELWINFLADPDAVAATRGAGALSNVELEALRQVARAASWRAPYVAGWPISRLRPGAASTASILDEQRSTMSSGAGVARDHSAVRAGEPGGCLLATDWQSRMDAAMEHPGSGDALIIVPPWGDVNRPSIAAHTLQAVAKEKGLRVRVLYANVLLASIMGLKEYQTVAFAPQAALLGEGLFSRAAYGLPSLSQRGGTVLESFLRQTSSKMKVAVSAADVAGFEAAVPILVDWIVDAIGGDYAVVGATSTFEQTSASIAILNRIKVRSPATLTIIGGANCDSEMAQGIRSLNADVDYIFSGESEAVFVSFLEGVRRGELPTGAIIAGKPLPSMEALPTPDYREFYAQRARYLPIEPGDESNVWLSYEASRGCWWGETRHCKFCGLNGTTMSLRQKSAAKVASELREMIAIHPSSSVWMADNIMPYNYYKELLPILAGDMPEMHIYWDQKSNLNLQKMAALKAANVAVVQPGVEALSTGMLKLMDKGVKAYQNVATLRYGRALDLAITWNILFDLPNDLPEYYREQIEMMPYLHHLGPPTWLARINIDRFSPYFFAADENGVHDLTPLPAYKYTFPPEADLAKLAYHFIGTYQKASDDSPQLLDQLADEFDRWRAAWTSAKPVPSLFVTEAGNGDYLLLDTRELAVERLCLITADQARAVLVGGPLRYVPPQLLKWILSRKVALVLDGRYVPLAVAEPDVLAAFEQTAWSTDDAAIGSADLPLKPTFKEIESVPEL